MQNTPTGPLDTTPVDENAPAVVLDAKDGDTVASAAAPTRRRAVWVSAIAVTALLAVVAGGYFTIQAIQRAQALDAFDSAISDRAAAYAAQDDAIAALAESQQQAVDVYTPVLTIGTTLTDSTVDAPQARADVLAAAADLANTAWIELDETSLPLEEQAPVVEALIPAVPLTGPKPSEDLDVLAAQTVELRDDETAIDSYTKLLTGISADIAAGIDAATTTVDVALDSAAAKGQALVYDRAPDETAAVVAAAAALVTDEAADAPLEDKAVLVGAYLTAVRAASAKQDAVIAAEKAEADRIAAEQQRQNNTGSRGTSNGSRGNSNGSWNGGSKPGTGNSNPGSGATNPGNGGTNPGGGGSNWQPLKLAFSGSTCSGAGGGQEATYGSTLNVPGTSVGSYSTYEIPGYGWGVTWKCKHW